MKELQLKKRIWAWLTLPNLGDRELNRQAKLLNGALSVLLLATMTLFIVFFTLVKGDYGAIALVISAIGFELGGLALLRRQKIQLVARGTIYWLWILLESSVYFLAGINGPSVLGQMLLIIVAGLLVNEKLGVTLGFLTIVINYGAMVNQASGRLPTFVPENQLLTQWVLQSIYFLLAIGLTQMSARSIRAAMTEARWNEQVLKDRVMELRQAQMQLEMSEQTLLRREAILEAVGMAAERLFRDESFQQSIERVLEELGHATGADRVYLFENHLEGKSLHCSQRAEWTAEDVEAQIHNPDLQDWALVDSGFIRWKEVLGRNMMLKGNVRDFPDLERNFLERQAILSILVVPIFIHDEWWGFMGFDETKWEREWSPAEEDALRAAAGILGGAIERRSAEARLNQSEARYLAILEDQVDIICRFTPDGCLTFGNNAFCEFFGLKRDEVEGKNYWEMIPAREMEAVKQKISSLGPGSPVAVSQATAHIAGKEMIWQEWTDRGIFGEKGNLVEVQAVGRDVTEEVRLKEQLHESLDKMAAQAMTDPLTGLLNRRAIMDHAEAEWQRSSREGSPMSLVLVDVDQLKEINDEFGHLAGDKLLVTAANLMQSGMRRYDWVGRWGGDEFLLVLPGTEVGEAKKVADRLHGLVRKTRVKLDENLNIGLLISIGIASQVKIDRNMDSLEDLLARADQAMYRAKEAGRDRVGIVE